MHLDAAVISTQRHRARRQVGHRQDRVLQVAEQRARRAGAAVGRVVVVVDHRIATGVHQAGQLCLGLLTPAGQQAVAHLLVRGLAACCQVAEPAPVDHLEPVFLAGVERVDPQVDPAAQLLQQRQVHRRDGGQAKHMGHHRQARRGHRRRAEAQVLQCAGGGGRCQFGRQLGHQPAPQRGLPGFVGRRAASWQRLLSFGPGLQPVGPVGAVLVEQAGHPLRQIEPGHGIGLRQVGRQPRLAGQPGAVGQRGVHPPGQRAGLPGRARRCHAGAGLQRRHGIQHPPGLQPQPLRQVGKAQVGAHAVLPRQPQCELAAHGRAGHDQFVGGEQAARVLAQRVGQQRGQAFITVGEVDREHGGGGLRAIVGPACWRLAPTGLVRRRCCRAAGSGREPGRRRA